MQTLTGGVDVLKPGTNVLVNRRGDVPVSLNWQTLRGVGRQASKRERPHKIIVSSASIAAGMIATENTVRPNKNTDMPELQRLASIGWRHILNAWDAAIPGKNTGGIQLTRETLNPHDISHSQERDEALRVMYTLLKHKEVPVLNENDAIAHEEISFGDNDFLAALTAVNIARSSLFEGNVRLFLLTNTNGVYEDINDPSSRIPVIENTADYWHLAQDSTSENSSGGMKSKFAAADIVNALGIDMWVYDPRSGSHRNRAIRGEIGTYFPARNGAVALGEQIDMQMIQSKA